MQPLSILHVGLRQSMDATDMHFACLHVDRGQSMDTTGMHFACLHVGLN
ncbi:MAG: hypothetical protein HFE64_05315 [Lachnospiraceae bacterium]|jgi:hypothetical protein|nr:hypothetical protein [Lachnospiraceae bacterium]